jgi:hypothetical protein
MWLEHLAEKVSQGTWSIHKPMYVHTHTILAVTAGREDRPCARMCGHPPADARHTL